VFSPHIPSYKAASPQFPAYIIQCWYKVCTKLWSTI